MKVKFSWVVGGIIAFFVFTIASLPAIQVIGRVTLPKHVYVSGVSGSIWSGKAQVLVVNGLTINNVKWDISALPLLWGSVNANVSAGNIRNANDIAFNGPLHINLFDLKHIETEKFTLYLPVDHVLAQIPLPLPVNAGGRFKVTLDELAFGPTCNTLAGKGNWLNATVAGTQGPISFGTFEAALRCQGEKIGITVAEPNLLGLSLDAVVPATFDSIQVSGKFKPDESLPQEVHQAAGFFGRPDNTGYYPIRL